MFAALTTNVREKLLEAGWDSDRRLEIGDAVTTLRGLGFEPSSVVLDFLGSLNGIRLILPNGVLEIGVERVRRLMQADDVADAQELFGKYGRDVRQRDTHARRSATNAGQ